MTLFAFAGIELVFTDLLLLELRDAVLSILTSTGGFSLTSCAIVKGDALPVVFNFS